MAMNWCTKEWLVGYVTQRLRETPRSKRYVRLIEDALPATRRKLDLDWLESGDREGYRAREQTNVIGCLSFAWHARELTSHEDPELLDELRRAYLGVVAHITEEGQFVWPNDQDMYWAGSHEHAWRLEPLLIGFIWIGNALPDADRASIEAGLSCAANWLIDHPCDQANNRGAVWCAITALCGILFGRADALAMADTLGKRIMPEIILDDGEIGEHTEQYAGGGPCTNYTYTGLGYVYLYLLLSDAEWLQERLHNGMRWLTRFNTVGGYPLATGASVRSGSPKSPIQDALPALERLSEADGFFGWIADRYTDFVADGGAAFGGHITCPLIWAALASGDASTEDRPGWFLNQLTTYSRPNVEYTLYSGRYQAGITFRSRKGPYRNVPEEGLPFRGIQAFAWEDEPPFVFQTPGIQSGIHSEGTLSNKEDVQDPELNVRSFSLPEGFLITERKERVTVSYAFLPTAMLIRIQSVDPSFRVFWALGDVSEDGIAFEPDPGVVAFANRKGRLNFSGGNTELYRHTEGTDTRWVLDVIADSPVVFAFTEEHFAFDSIDPSGRTVFTDAAGAQEVDFSMLAGQSGELAADVSAEVIRNI